MVNIQSLLLIQMCSVHTVYRCFVQVWWCVCGVQCGEFVDRCAGCEALLQSLEAQVTTANSRKDKESKIALQIEQEV